MRRGIIFAVHTWNDEAWDQEQNRLVKFTTSKPEPMRTMLELPKHSLKQTKLHHKLASHYTLDSPRPITDSSPRTVETQDSQTFRAANLLTAFPRIIAMQTLSPTDFPRCKFANRVPQNYCHANIVTLPKRSAGGCHNSNVAPHEQPRLSSRLDPMFDHHVF